jgi:predicted NAD/FAD-dependent oxidoreductase
MINNNRKGRVNMRKESPIIILGAGLTGLFAAQELKKKSIPSLLIEKGRSVGGRMATRRIQSGRADHGAQFFTARSDVMKSLVDSWMKEGTVNEWTKGFHQMDLGGKVHLETDGYPRYVGSTSMNALTKSLVDENDILLNHRAVHLDYQKQQWQLEVINEQDSVTETVQAAGIISTIPIPQVLTWMNLGLLESDIKMELANITYDPCICLMVTLRNDSRIPPKGGIQGEGDVAFIGDNQQKGISTKPIITIHASGEWSSNNFDAADDEVTSFLLKQVESLISPNEVEEVQVKRWRYAKPRSLYPDRVLATTYPSPIVFAGDCFKEGKVEGAVLSGMEAGKRMSRYLKK